MTIKLNTDAAFVTREQKARLSTGLDTNKGSFAQVVALSQSLINDAFKKLYDKNPVLQVCKVDCVWGRIIGTLDPSTILIPKDGDQNLVYFQLRFKHAWMKVKMSQGTFDVPLDGWVIASRVPMDPPDLDLQVGDDNEMLQQKRIRYDLLRKAFTCPTVYSLQHLYAVLSDCWWLESNLDLEKSTILYKGTDLAGSNTDKVMDLSFIVHSARQLLRRIAEEWRKAAPDSIGPKMAPNVAKIAVAPPANAWVNTMRHNRYCYKLAPDCPDGDEGFDDPASRNCLLYCESLPNTISPADPLRQTGNYTGVGGGVDSPHRFDSSVSLHYGVVLDRFCNTYARALAFETQIMPKAPEYSDYGGYTGIKFKYTFGKSDLKEANNEGVYQFKRDLSNNQTKVSATVQASISDPKRRNNTAASWWSWFNSSGSHTLTINWWVGATKLTLHGVSVFVVDIKQARVEDINPSSNDRVVYYCRDEVTVKWDVTVDLSVSSNGEIKLVAPAKPEVSADYKTTPARGLTSPKAFGTPPDQPSPQDNAVKSQLINEVSARLQKRLGEFGVLFTIPSGDVFEFSKPMWTNGGDFLVQTKYKDVPPSVVFAAHALNPTGETTDPLVQKQG